MNTTLRNRFHNDGVAAMTQERLLLALYDRLLLDLDRAVEGIRDGKPVKTHERLVHAQQIVEELHMALDVEAWPDAARLASVYLYALDKLVEANMRKDVALVVEVKQIFEPLGATWHEAYEQISGNRTAGGAASTGAPRQMASDGGRAEFGA
jgi:flagellar protein FliS